MKRTMVLFGGLTLLLGLVAAQNASDQAPADSGKDRGQYIVHHLAMCVQCHSPRDQRGELIRTRLLKGAPVPVSSPFADQEWAFHAPAIAGLPGWSRSDAVFLLQNAERRDGSRPRPPMPPFRMTREDAEAVVNYLMSLP